MNVLQYNVFSTLDLQSAYHQVEFPDAAKIFTTFEANGQLFEFSRLPFGFKNAVPCLQHIINSRLLSKTIAKVHKHIWTILLLEEKLKKSTTKTFIIF